MNEKPSPSRWDDAQAAPEALGALLARFPAYAFESECQRSLDMIVLCQRYISRLVEEQNSPQADELRQSLSDLAVAANRLDRNLGSLTSLLRCVQQTEVPVWEPVELCALARTLCAEKALLQKDLRIRLTLDCGGLQELTVQADRRYLNRICLHLLSNAVRACTPGGGRITLAIRPGQEGGAVLTVTDTGCGLPDGSPRSEQENRAHFLGTTKSGLLLCQEYCRLSGWTLVLRPRAKGRGAEAVLTLPPRAAFDPSPTLRASGEEDARRNARRLWFDLAFELQCLPGLEEVRFEPPPELREF